MLSGNNNISTYDILSEGSRIDDNLEVLSISVCKEVNRIPTAKIIIRDGEVSQEDFEVSNKDYFVPGKKIEIKLGWDGNNEIAFAGIVTKISVRLKNSHPTLQVECRDECSKMTIGKKSKYFDNSTDSQMIEEIISDYSRITKDIVDDTQLEHPHIVQYHVTDWDFILSRADANGMLVFVSDNEISLKKPDTNQASKMEFNYGDNLLSFDAEIDGRYQYQSVASQSWDYANQELFSAESAELNITEAGNIEASRIAEETTDLQSFKIQHSGRLVEEELQRWADACMQRSRLSKVRGTLSVREGNSMLKPGDMVKLNGMGDRFNGKVFVSAIRHEFSNGLWSLHVQFGLCPEAFSKKEDIIDIQASGLLPAINGLQIGKVIQLENDPDGEDRILVRLPIIDPASNGLWARVTSLDAGENRGAFFRPEIDDEVIVGFINDDPRDAIVLGMLNSSNKPAPISAKDVNHEKGFVTRDELKFLFDDDKKKITISTPNGNSITIDESSKSIEILDENDNKYVMSPSGIELDSPKDIMISAGKSISIEAKTEIKLKGLSIKNEASTTCECKGASVKIAAQGIAEISGSLIKIN